MSYVSIWMRDRARELRKVLTVSEQRLWKWLRNRAFGGHKFRRQVPAGRYILDFYCPALRLAIEVDGQHHEQPGMREYDEERSARLAAMGIRVVRIANVTLATDSPLVEEHLLYEIEQRVAETARR